MNKKNQWDNLATHCFQLVRRGSGLRVLMHKFQSVEKRYMPWWSGIFVSGFKCVCTEPVFFGYWQKEMECVTLLTLKKRA
jgi:hypothetical protein